MSDDCRPGVNYTDADFEAVGHFGRLRAIRCTGTGISDKGIECLRDLPDLEEVSLSGNGSFTDSGLRCLAGHRKLAALYLDLQLDAQFEGVTDAGVENLGSLSNLELLHLGCSNITETGVARIAASFPKLCDLELNNTKTTDVGVAHLTTLTRLKDLGLRQTRVTDSGIARLAALRPLESLDLGETAVTDQGAAAVVAMSSLRGLGLDGTKVGDEGLAKIAGLKKLEHLDLINCPITDAGLRYLVRMRSLKQMELGGRVSQEVVDSL